MMRKLSLLVLIILLSCEDDGISPIYGCMNESALNYVENANVDNDTCDLGSSDYLQYIQPIFDANCTSCHDADHDSGLDLTSGSSYNSIFDNEAVEPGDSSASELYDRITRDNSDEGDMPPGNAELDTPDIDLIGQWINGLP